MVLKTQQQINSRQTVNNQKRKFIIMTRAIRTIALRERKQLDRISVLSNIYKKKTLQVIISYQNVALKRVK